MVGGTLIVAIVVLLAVVTSMLAFGLVEDSPTAPTAVFEVEPGECGHELRHVTGDRVDGARVELLGVDDLGALGGRTLTAGDSQQLDPVEDELELVWSAADEDDSHVMARLDVGGANDIEHLNDGTGNRIDGSDGTGLV